MPNVQALGKIAAAMRVIEQDQIALSWLEDYRADLLKGPPERKMIEISPQTSGSGLTGFKEAKMRLDGWLKLHNLAMLDGAIAECRQNIQAAEDQIKQWSVVL